jgi:hypothetical protein
MRTRRCRGRDRSAHPAWPRRSGTRAGSPRLRVGRGEPHRREVSLLGNVLDARGVGRPM